MSKSNVNDTIPTMDETEACDCPECTDARENAATVSEWTLERIRNASMEELIVGSEGLAAAGAVRHTLDGLESADSLNRIGVSESAFALTVATMALNRSMSELRAEWYAIKAEMAKRRS